MLPEQQQRILGYFIEEAQDHLNTIEQGLLNLQATLDDPEMINEVFRAAHSIKGGAAMLSLNSIQRTAHRLEDCFKVLKENPITVDQKLESLFLGVSDTLKALLEHLSGPFGLSEEAANNLMSEAEPVFTWLNEHLEALVGEQGGTVIKVSTESESEQSSQSLDAQTYVPDADDWQQFQHQVLQKLRDMLQLFKQNATPSSRKGLEACCQYLAAIGQDLKLTNWCHLCRSAANAVTNPDNSYLMLAKVIITEIKTAQELALAGRDSEITISPQLEALIAVPNIELLELSSDFFAHQANDSNTASVEIHDINQTQAPTQQDNINTSIDGGLFDNQNQVDISHVEFKLEEHETETDITSQLDISELDLGELDINSLDDTIESLFELSEAIELSNVLDNSDLVIPDNHSNNQDNISSLFELNEQIENNQASSIDATINAKITPFEMSSLLETDADEDASATNIILDPHGPEVGIAELTELDELFRDDAHELDDTWHGEKIPEPNINSDTNHLDSTDVEVNDSELDDLLVFEDSTNFYDRSEYTHSELTVVQLFGSSLDDDEFDTTNSAEDGTPITSETIFASIPPQLPSHQNDISSEDVDSQAVLTTEFTNHDVSRLDDESDSHSNLLDTSFDDLFTSSSSSDSQDEITLIEESLQEHSTDNFNLDDLFVDETAIIDLSDNGEQHNNNNNIDSIDDIFGAPIPTSPEFSQPQDDFASFWAQPEQSDTTFGYEVNHDVTTALEASLFAATESHDLLETEQVITDSDDFDLDSNDSDALTSEPTFNLFEEFSLEQISAFSNDVQQNLQQPEVLELQPEFTHSSVTEDKQDSLDDFFNVDVDVDTHEAPSTSLAIEQTIDKTSIQSFDSEEISYADELSSEELESLAAILEPVDATNEPTEELHSLFTESLNNIPQNHEYIDNTTETARESDVEEKNTSPLTIPTEGTSPLEDNQLEDNQLVAPSDLDEFAYLESLLSEGASEPIDFIPEEEFAALSALLDESTPQLETPLANNDSRLDEFGDLEKMLAEADNSVSSQGGANAAQIQRPSPRRTARFEQLMKVPVKHLDDMSNLVGELVVNRNTLEQDQERLRQSLDNLLIQIHQLSDVGARMQELYERSLLESSLLATRKHGLSGGYNSSSNKDNDRGFSELEMDRFTPFHTLSQEMIELIVRVRESASDIDFVTEETERVARQFRQVTTQLQEGLTRARMVPFSQVTDRVKRGVRDNAIKCGKQVELVIEGQDTLIDKMILEHLTDPLIHMLNNAIAHGIETPDERVSKGKQPVGTIFMRAFHQGNQTVISVSDDGAGINHENVKQKALKVGLITPEQAKTISRMEIYELLFQPNFSTKDKADDLAGRGVGMDVVRTSISEIRGTISTDSTIGSGTSFTIRLPLTLSICKALCCVWDKARIAFPMDGVEDTLDVPVKNIQKNAEGESFILWRDTKLPFKPLKELLTLNRQLSRGSVYGGTRDDDMVSVVVIRSASTLIGLQVDSVLSEQEIVIKQFEGPAPKPLGVAGATVLGDGRIMPIADVLEIIDIFQGRTALTSSVPFFETSTNNTESTGASIDPTVLIVDDSITVRELLSLSFNKAGYRVEQARDGQEAWEKLRSGLPCDIVFCDIEMPRCDGLELLSRISKEPSLSKLPIAMLTSRGADKHKQMAINLGASGYFTKPYLEEALLEAASRMLKGEKLVSPNG